LDYISFRKIPKITNLLKICLGVKPLLKNIGSRHNEIFSKMSVLKGGLTLVPRYKMQPSFHQALPAKHV